MNPDLSLHAAAFQARHTIGADARAWLRRRVAAWLHPTAGRMAWYGELGVGQALTLQVPCPSVLEVHQHGLWLTVSGHGQAAQCDVFVHAGQHLRLAAGSEVVLEPHFATGTARATALHAQAAFVLRSESGY